MSDIKKCKTLFIIRQKVIFKELHLLRISDKS